MKKKTKLYRYISYCMSLSMLICIIIIQTDFFGLSKYYIGWLGIIVILSLLDFVVMYDLSHNVDTDGIS